MQFGSTETPPCCLTITCNFTVTRDLLMLWTGKIGPVPGKGWRTWALGNSRSHLHLSFSLPLNPHLLRTHCLISATSFDSFCGGKSHLLVWVEICHQLSVSKSYWLQCHFWTGASGERIWAFHKSKVERNSFVVPVNWQCAGGKFQNIAGVLFFW